MAKTRNGVIAALDIGTSKVVCFVARVDGQGRGRDPDGGQRHEHHQGGAGLHGENPRIKPLAA